MAFNYKLLAQVKEAAAKQAGDRVRVVIPYEDQYLLETLSNPKWPANLGKRRFIGGGIDEGETPEQAAARELMEELGVQVDTKKFKHLGLDPNEQSHNIHYLQLNKHKIKPGEYKATVGSDPFIYLNKGLPQGDDYMGADLKSLMKQIKKASAEQRLAVIIRGNPKFITGNPKADAFYAKLQKHLEQKGYQVQQDAGEPLTVPPKADVWLGHSRGSDRLRFAPEGTSTIALGTREGITHPKDTNLNPGDTPTDAHYLLTKKMLKLLDAKLN